MLASHRKMNRKIALVTGGTSGVGLSIVRALVQHNFGVFFIGTNKEKGKEIEAELNSANNTKNKFIALDLSNLNEVNTFANQFKSDAPKLDLLVNVAGIMLPKRQETAEGIEKTFATGYLSAFILCNAFIPLLEKGNQARIVNVSGSPSHVLKVNIDFDNLNFVKNYSGFKTAIATVHAKTVLTEILAKKLKDKNIDVNAFHPGTVKSNLTRNMHFLLKGLAKIATFFMASASKTGIYVSLSDNIVGTTGQLFVNKKPTPLRFDMAYKERLWEVTEGIAGRTLLKN